MDAAMENRLGRIEQQVIMLTEGQQALKGKIESMVNRVVNRMEELFIRLQENRGDWATEYEQQYSGGQSWTDQFANEQISHGPHGWTNEFAAERELHGSAEDECVSEFSKLNINDWSEEFERQVADGTLGETSGDNWANAYDEYLNEQTAMKLKSETSRGVYEFSDLNPYVGHPNPLKERAVLQGNANNELGRCLESGDPAVQDFKGGHLVFVAAGSDPFDVITNERGLVRMVFDPGGRFTDHHQPKFQIPEIASLRASLV